MRTPSPGPAFLTLPEAGDTAYRKVLRKVRLRALGHLLHLGTAPPAPAPGMATLARVLAPTAKKHTATVLSAVGLHDVITPLLCHRSGLCSLDDVLDTAIPTFLAALGAAHILPEAILWDRAFPRLLDSRTGLEHRSETGRIDGMLADQSGIEIRVGGQFWRLGSQPVPSVLATRRVLHAVSRGLQVSLVDTNPLSMIEAHPDKAGNALSLGERPLSDWTDALGDSLKLIQAGLPEWAASLPRTPVRVVPVGFEPEKHLSASYREALGVAYMTLHPSTLTLAEALVHETQHSRINTLLLLDPVFENAQTTWTPSPVRPDLRPLAGVLLAVHAFVPVAVLHARLAAMDHPLAQTDDDAFAMRRAAVLVGNERGLRTCQELARPTAMGQRLMRAMQQVHAWTCAQHPGGLAGARAACADALPEGVPLQVPPC